MTNQFNASLFDFSNTADLPQEVADKLNKEKSEKAKLYGELVSAAGRSVGISEIEAAAVRAFGAKDVPSQATIRKYLNDAVEFGYLVKPTRQSYAKVGTPVEEVEGTGDDATGEGVAVGTEAPAVVDPLEAALA